MKHKLIRPISIILSITFLWQNLLWANIEGFYSLRPVAFRDRPAQKRPSPSRMTPETTPETKLEKSRPHFLTIRKRRRQALKMALAYTGWDIRETAKDLGKTFATVYNWIKNYNLQKPPDAKEKRIELNEREVEELNIHKIDKRACEEAMSRAKGNIKMASHLLGISEPTLRNWLKKYADEPSVKPHQSLEEPEQGKIVRRQEPIEPTPNIPEIVEEEATQAGADSGARIIEQVLAIFNFKGQKEIVDILRSDPKARNDVLDRLIASQTRKEWVPVYGELLMLTAANKVIEKTIGTLGVRGQKGVLPRQHKVYGLDHASYMGGPIPLSYGGSEPPFTVLPPKEEGILEEASKFNADFESRLDKEASRLGEEPTEKEVEKAAESLRAFAYKWWQGMVKQRDTKTFRKTLRGLRITYLKALRKIIRFKDYHDIRRLINSTDIRWPTGEKVVIDDIARFNIIGLHIDNRGGWCVSRSRGRFHIDKVTKKSESYYVMVPGSVPDEGKLNIRAIIENPDLVIENPSLTTEENLRLVLGMLKDYMPYEEGKPTDYAKTKDFLKRFGMALRGFHDNGFIHRFPALHNFSLFNNRFIIHDLDNAMDASGMTKEQMIGYRKLDLAHAIAYLKLVIDRLNKPYIPKNITDSVLEGYSSDTLASFNFEIGEIGDGPQGATPQDEPKPRPPDILGGVPKDGLGRRQSEAERKGRSAARTAGLTLEAKCKRWEDSLVFQDGLLIPHIIADSDKKHGSFLGNYENCNIWTNLYWAAESMAYAATKDASRKEKAQELLRPWMKLQDVTGAPGVVARGYKKSSSETWDELYYWRYTDIKDKWHQNGEERWLGDMSKGQLFPVYFGALSYYNLVAEEREKEEIKRRVKVLTDHLIKNNYRITDIDGKATTYGDFNPKLYRFGLDGLSPLLALSILKTAHHITGNDFYLREYLRLARDKKFAEKARRSCINIGAFTSNHSDVALAYLSYFTLLQLEKNPEFIGLYREGLLRTHKLVSQEQNALFNFIYQIVTGDDRGYPDAIEALNGYPLPGKVDVIAYRATTLKSSKRNRILQIFNLGKVVPIAETEPDEYMWRKDPYKRTKWQQDPSITSKGSMIISDIGYPFAYWLGRYHGLFAKERLPSEELARRQTEEKKPAKEEKKPAKEGTGLGSSREPSPTTTGSVSQDARLGELRNINRVLETSI